MHAHAIVAQQVEAFLDNLHSKLANTLAQAVCAALDGHALQLCDLARGLADDTAVRYRVKRIDRLLGNPHLAADRFEIYCAMSHALLSEVERVLVVVDWSPVTVDQRWQLLRASAVIEARSCTLYEEVHRRKHLGSPKVHRAFVHRLAACLPAGVKPIIMTDAGFRAAWFKLIAQFGWAWVGRIRNRDMVCAEGQAHWHGCRTLYAQATAQARWLGRYSYVRSNPIACHLALVKRAAKSRHRLTYDGHISRANVSRKHQRREHEPWLLAVSPQLAHLSAEAVVALYAQRMQIEQSFRDLKNAWLGLGLSRSRSRSGARFEALLLIGHLAERLLHALGSGARAQQLELPFQCTNRRTRHELSITHLGARVWRTIAAPPIMRYCKAFTARMRLAHLTLPVFPLPEF